MRRFCRLALAFLCLGLLFSSTSPAADSQYSVVEAFLGASAINGPLNVSRATMPGLHLGMALNPRRYLRLTAEFSAHYKGADIQSDLSNEKVRLSEYHFWGGPEFPFRRNGGLTPFVHSLFGIAARHYTIPSNGPQTSRDILAVDHGFASAYGGGVDIRLSRRWAVRAIQFDYIITHLRQDQPHLSPIEDHLPVLEGWQHHYRLAFSMAVRFGDSTR